MKIRTIQIKIRTNQIKNKNKPDKKKNKPDINQNKPDRNNNKSIQPDKDKYLNIEKERTCFEFCKTSYISYVKKYVKE